MDFKPFHKALAVITVGFLSVATLSVRAGADDQWQAWTSLKNVQAMTAVHDTLYAATAGGLLVVDDPQNPGREFTNIDGLGSNDLTDVIGDAGGQIWIAAAGRLVRFVPDASQQYLFSNEDGDPIRLTCLADDESSLWVGTEIGLVLFSKDIDGGQIQDSYGRFGDLSDFPQVNDIVLKGDSIWLATSAGLAVADLTDPRLLKQRSSWTTYDAALLGSGMVSHLAWFEGDLYFSNISGLNRFHLAAGSPEVTPVVASTNVPYYDLVVIGDTLFYFNAQRVGYVVDQTPGIAAISGLGSAATGMAMLDGRRWLGTTNHGLYNEANDSLVPYPFSGLPGADVSDLTIDEDGVITAGFTKTKAARLIDGAWRTLDFSIGEKSTWLIADPDGRPFVGTRGNGLWTVDADTLINYDENNSTMRGNSDDPPNGLRYVFINGIASTDDYLFVSCYRAVNGYPIAITRWDDMDDPTSGWDSLGVTDGLTTDRTYQIDYYAGELAVGTEATGVYICPLGDDPWQRPRDLCRHLTRANSLLRSDIARVVEYDIDGTLWVGTNEGLSRYDLGIERFVDVDLPAGIDRNITDLEFDSRGNLWVGTAAGLARFDRSENEFTLFSMAGGQLVNDEIRALYYDAHTGDFYVATAGGISRLPSQSGEPQSDIDLVLAFPNPFEIHSGSEYLSFDFAHPGTVRIFTAAGELIRILDVNQRWYGRNDSGRPVASGVYLWVLTDQSGQVGRGKILLVRH
ncbi:MAG: two-component regulator propeller domain-containing protein [bacterium]